MSAPFSAFRALWAASMLSLLVVAAGVPARFVRAQEGQQAKTSADQDGDPDTEGATDDDPPADPIDFMTQVKPLIEARCLRCHGPDEAEADFRIDDRDAAFNYLEPGDLEFSEWYERVSTDDEEMQMPPPDEGGPLPAEEIELFKNWILQGASWPESAVLMPPPEEVAQAIEEEIQQEAAVADQQKTSWELLWDVLGLLHPLAVHFPVAMILGAALFGLLGLRSESPFSDAAYYCLWLGALGAVLAAFSGWSFAYHESYLNWQSMQWDRTIDLHRWGGVLTATLAVLLAVCATISRRRDPYASGVVWKLGLVLLAVLVGFVGHQGGKMTHEGLEQELIEKTQLLADKVTGAAAEDEAAPEEATSEDDGASGKTSQSSDED